MEPCGIPLSRKNVGARGSTSIYKSLESELRVKTDRSMLKKAAYPGPSFLAKEGEVKFLKDS